MCLLKGTDVVLVEVLPLVGAAVDEKILGEGRAAVGGGQVGEHVLKGVAIRMLIQKRSDDGHQRTQKSLVTKVGT